MSKDARDIRLLADIIALILDKETGEAMNALEHLRQRAQKSEITGGALKNLFSHLAEKYHIKNPPPFSNQEKLRAKQEEKLKHQIKILLNKQYELQNFIRTLENKISYLRDDNASFYYINAYQKIIIIIAIIFGILIGISLAKIF